MASTDDIYNSLDALNDEFASFTKVLDANAKTSNSLNAVMKAEIAQKQKQKAAQDKLANSIKSTAVGLTSFGKSLISGQGSFQPLTTVVTLVSKVLGELAGKIPVLGGAFKGMIEGAGQVTNFMIEQFDRTYGVFEKLSDSGVVSTFTDLKEAAMGMNLSIADSEEVLAKHSKNLALFTGSAIDGRKQFQAMASMSATTRTDFQKLGISSKEFSDMQLSYLNQQMRLTGGQKQTVEQMTKGSEEYIKEIDLIAKITGMSRKAIMSDRDARLNDARFVASMADLPKKVKDNINTGLDATTAFAGKNFSQALQDIISTDGLGITKGGTALVKALTNSGLNVSNMVAGLKNGSISWTQMLGMLTTTAKKNVGEFKNLASLLGTDLEINSMFEGMNKLSLLDGKDFQKQLEDEIAKQNKVIADTESDNANLAKTKQSMENLQKTMEQMATNSELVAKMLPRVAEGLTEVMINIFEKTGMTVPPLLKAQHEYMKAQRRETEVINNIANASRDVETLKNVRTDEAGHARERRRLYNSTRLLANASEAEATAREDAEAAKKAMEDTLKREREKTDTGGAPSSPPPTPAPSSTNRPSAPPAQAAPTGGNNTPMVPPPQMPQPSSQDSGSSSAAPSSGTGMPAVSYTPSTPGSPPGVKGASNNTVASRSLPSSPAAKKDNNSQMIETLKETVMAKWDRFITIEQDVADANSKRLKRKLA